MGNRNVFLDTNVVLNILDETRSKHIESVKLWEKLVLEDYQIFISEDMLSTIFYINRNDKIRTLEFFKLIQKRWTIVPFGEDVIAESIDLSIEKNLDLEDVLQCISARENGCKVFITNDKKFYNCGIDVMDCSQFL